MALLQSKNNKECSCADTSLCLDSRHLSWLISGVVFLGFVLFIAGYFLGKQKAVRDLEITLNQHSLADKIYTSLCTIQEDSHAIAHHEENKNDAVDIPELTCESPEENLMVSAPSIKPTLPSLPEITPSSKKYCAQLVGFGTERAAQAFAKRLQSNNMPVLVKNRQSKTVKGKLITWYQVVTEEFADKKELENLIQHISAQEKLKDVRILTC